MIREEIKRAKILFGRYGEALCRQEAVSRLVERYRNAIAKTQEVMRTSGVVETCSACALQGSGSCCFQGVEEWYDYALLLMNLLLGVKIPERSVVPEGCLFLGQGGCRLLARHPFCVNYLCPSLEGRLGETHRRKLASVSGEELFCGWEMERWVRKWLWQQRGE